MTGNKGNGQGIKIQKIIWASMIWYFETYKLTPFCFVIRYQLGHSMPTHQMVAAAPHANTPNGRSSTSCQRTKWLPQHALPMHQMVAAAPHANAPNGRCSTSCQCTKWSLLHLMPTHQMVAAAPHANAPNDRHSTPCQCTKWSLQHPFRLSCQFTVG